MEVPHVHRIQEEDRLTCVLDESIFQCPSGYSQIGNGNIYTIILFFTLILIINYLDIEIVTKINFIKYYSCFRCPKTI